MLFLGNAKEKIMRTVSCFYECENWKATLKPKKGDCCVFCSMKLKKLLDDMAPASQVEKQMKDCADTKVRMKVAAYETAGKMKAMLNNDQKEQLKNMMMHQQGMMQGQGGMMKQGGMMQNQNSQ